MRSLEVEHDLRCVVPVVGILFRVAWKLPFQKVCSGDEFLIGPFGSQILSHQEAFGEIAPATSMVEVSRLIDPAMLIEIEADAIVGDG